MGRNPCRRRSTSFMTLMFLKEHCLSGLKGGSGQRFGYLPAMELSLRVDGRSFAVDTASGVDASIAISPSEGNPFSEGAVVRAFGIPAASAAPLTFGSWVGAVDAGASVNCPVLSACFHGVGTHTECVGHALAEHVYLHRDIPVTRSLVPALVVTVSPQTYAAAEGCGEGGYIAAKPEDKVLSVAALTNGLRKLAESSSTAAELVRSEEGLRAVLADSALVIRTAPNALHKRTTDYSGTNPTYLLPSLARWAVEHGVQHLLLDLPSADREEDGGHLQAHRAFWGLPPKAAAADAAAGAGAAGAEAFAAAAPAPPAVAGAGAVGGGGSSDDGPRCSRTITELCFVPDAAPDGLYLLQLGVAPIELDAAPSRPVLFPLRPL